MQPRMKHPAFIVPGAMDALQALSTATEQAGLSPNLIQLVQLRASQINGCSVCLDGHAKILKKLNEPDDRIIAVAAWRDTPYFTERRTSRPRPNRIPNANGRPTRPRPRRHLQRSHQTLPRPPTSRAHPIDRQHQRLEPPQRGNSPTSRRVETLRKGDRENQNPKVVAHRVPRSNVAPTYGFDYGQTTLCITRTTYISARAVGWGGRVWGPSGSV